MPPPPVSRQSLSTGRSDVLLTLALGAFFLLLIIPGAQGSPFEGIPTTSLGRLVLVGLFSLATFLVIFKPASDVRARWLGVLLFAALLKILAGAQGATLGWHGTYELTDTKPAAIAPFAWQLSRHNFRLDREIDFYDSGFGLHFLNDILRYGSNFALRTRDVDLPLRISWTGYLEPDTREPVVVYVNGHGRFTIALDGWGYVETTDPKMAVVQLPALSPKPVHSLQVIYDKPAHVVPAAKVIVTSGDRILEVTPWPAAAMPAWKARGAVMLTTASVLAGAGALSWLFLAAFWGRVPRRLDCRAGGDLVVGLAVAVTCAAFGLLAWSNARPMTGATVHLSPGDDPLMYESAARDVVHNGLLMAFGAPIGHGSPYFFYPLYSYVRAATQVLVGEDFAVAILLSGLCLAALPLLFWTLGWSTLRARWGGVAGVLVLAWFLHRHVVYYTLWGFTDVLFIFTVFVSLNLVRIAVQRSSAWLVVSAGIASAFTAACRPSFMTFVPLLVMGCAFVPAVGPLRMRRRLATFLVIGFLLGLAPFATRNYVMSGKLVLLVNSWIQIPYFLVPPEVSNPVALRPDQPPPTFGESVSWAWSIIRGDPYSAVVVELRKIAFTAGFTQLGMPGQTFYHKFHLEFVLLTLGFIIVVVRRLLPLGTSLTITCFALSHLAAMILAAPWTYGYKSILPLQLTFLFAVVAAFPPLWRVRGCAGTVWNFIQSHTPAAILVPVLASAGLALSGCRPPAATIDVLGGTYGGNCGAPRGNVTTPLASVCGGKLKCVYRIDVGTLGDTAPGCSKDFEAVWRCGRARELRRTSAQGEAGFGSIVRLMCP